MFLQSVTRSLILQVCLEHLFEKIHANFNSPKQKFRKGQKFSKIIYRNSNGIDIIYEETTVSRIDSDYVELISVYDPYTVGYPLKLSKWAFNNFILYFEDVKNCIFIP